MLGAFFAISLLLASAGADGAPSCPSLGATPKTLADGRRPDAFFVSERLKLKRELKANCAAADEKRETLAKLKADLVFNAGQIQELEAEDVDAAKAAQANESKIELTRQLDEAAQELARLERDSQRIVKRYDRMLEGRDRHPAKSKKKRSKAKAEKKKKKSGKKKSSESRPPVTRERAN